MLTIQHLWTWMNRKLEIEGLEEGESDVRISLHVLMMIRYGEEQVS